MKARAEFRFPSAFLLIEIFGSMERFLGILIEHFAGKFPMWMSPIPVRIIPVSDSHAPYGQEVMQKIQAAGFLCDIDDAHESVGKKVRNAQLTQINYMLTVGDNEVKNQTVSLRTRDNVVHGEVELPTFLKKVEKEYKERALTSAYQEAE